jgi:hypothetical protein
MDFFGGANRRTGAYKNHRSILYLWILSQGHPDSKVDMLYMWLWHLWNMSFEWTWWNVQGPWGVASHGASLCLSSNCRIWLACALCKWGIGIMVLQKVYMGFIRLCSKKLYLLTSMRWPWKCIGLFAFLKNFSVPIVKDFVQLKKLEDWKQ